MFSRILSFFILCLFSISVLSQDARKQITQAEELCLDGKYSEALVILNRVLDKDSSNYSALVTRGMVYNSVDEIQKAFDDLSRAIKISPDSGRGYFFRGLVLFRTMYSEESIYDYTRALELVDDDSIRVKIYMNRGSAKQQKRDFQGGYEDYSKAYSLDTTNIDVLNNLGTVLDELGRRDEAIAYFKKIIKVNPEYMGGWVNLGFQHNKIGKYKEAIEYFNRALLLDGKDPLALNNRGYAKYMLKDYIGALEDINKSLSIFADNSYAYRNRALVHLAQNKREDACKDIDDALRLEFTKVYGEEVLELQKKNCIK